MSLIRVKVEGTLAPQNRFADGSRIFTRMDSPGIRMMIQVTLEAYGVPRRVSRRQDLRRSTNPLSQMAVAYGAVRAVSQNEYVPLLLLD